MNTPKVSVVIPVYNVDTYLCECLDSALAQTLKDIEIICVDDGSTDRCPQILDEYAQKDSRVKVIHKPNSGYGHTMNVGLDAATGEYMAILESDDLIKPNMYEVLYQEAKIHDVDVIKSDYEIFIGDKDSRQYTYKALTNKSNLYYKVINPARNLDAFNAAMMTWTGLYKISFLRENNIRHNETPGASYQDNGFWFQTFAWAKRIYFIDRAFYMLRRDNPNSSVHNRAKVFCIFEEYAFIEKRLRADPVKETLFIGIFHKKKFDNCRFHLDRVGDEFKMDFLRRMADEFKEARANGELDERLFIGSGYKTLTSIMDQTEQFYLNYMSGKEGFVPRTPQEEVFLLEKKLQAKDKELQDIQNSLSFRIGRMITFLPRKLRGAIWCCRDHGLTYTFRRAVIRLHILKEAPAIDYKQLQDQLQPQSEQIKGN